MNSLILLTIAAAAGIAQAPFKGIENDTALKGYSEVRSWGANTASAANGELVFSKSFAADSKSPHARRIDITIIRLPTTVKPTDAVKKYRAGIQAATMPMPMPEFKKLGFDTFYMGNPQVVDIELLSDHVWLSVQFRRPELRWQVQGGSNWAALGAEGLRKDKDAMARLKALLPDLKKRL
jgi:hypothetical protein